MESITPSNLFKDTGQVTSVGRGRTDWKYKIFSYLLLTLIVLTITVPFVWMLSDLVQARNRDTATNAIPG